MFDFRYHAMSLAAVFLALMVGLLLGVAIGDKGLVSSAGRNVRASLRSDVRQANARAADLRGQLRQRDAFERDAFPLLVAGRLGGQRIGVVALGGVSDREIRLVRDALKETGGRLTTVAVIRQPVPRDLLPGGGSKAAQVQRFGRRVGVAFTQGGGLLRRVGRRLLASSSGRLAGLEGVVLVRAPGDLKKPDAGIAKSFENGLVTGLTANDVPVVGVETTNADPSQISWFKQHDLASVDDIDDLSGQAALVFALAGANGAYGTKSTAEALLPKAAGG